MQVLKQVIHLFSARLLLLLFCLNTLVLFNTPPQLAHKHFILQVGLIQKLLKTAQQISKSHQNALRAQFFTKINHTPPLHVYFTQFILLQLNFRRLWHITLL